MIYTSGYVMLDLEVPGETRKLASSHIFKEGVESLDINYDISRRSY